MPLIMEEPEEPRRKISELMKGEGNLSIIILIPLKYENDCG